MIVFSRVQLAAVLLMSMAAMSGCGSDSDGVTVDDNNVVVQSDTQGDTQGDIQSDPETDAEQDATPEVVDNTEFEARYSVRFAASWSAETHPINFPPNPHFSPLTGAVHSEQVVIWQPGQNASDGIEEMAESGGTGVLLPEIQFAIDEGLSLIHISEPTRPY